MESVYPRGPHVEAAFHLNRSLWGSGNCLRMGMVFWGSTYALIDCMASFSGYGSVRPEPPVSLGTSMYFGKPSGLSKTLSSQSMWISARWGGRGGEIGNYLVCGLCPALIYGPAESN